MGLENRLNLNTKPEYILPTDTSIFSYNRSRDKDKVPKIGLRLVSVGARSGKLLKNNESVCGEIIISTTNIDIVNFVRNYDFTKLINLHGLNQKRQLDSWKVRKVISEWYYGIRE